MERPFLPRPQHKKIVAVFHAGDQYLVHIDDGPKAWVKVPRVNGPTPSSRMVISLSHLETLRHPGRWLTNVWVEEAIIYYLGTIGIGVQGTTNPGTTTGIWVTNEHQLKLPQVKEKLKKEMAGVADALLLSVNTTGPPTAPHHTLVIRGSRFQEITVDSFYGVKGVHADTISSSATVNTKSQQDSVNCGLHVVRAGVICAQLFVNGEKGTIEPNDIYEASLSDDLRFLLERTWWLGTSCTTSTGIGSSTSKTTQPAKQQSTTGTSSSHSTKPAKNESTTGSSSKGTKPAKEQGTTGTSSAKSTKSVDDDLIVCVKPVEGQAVRPKAKQTRTRKPKTKKQSSSSTKDVVQSSSSTKDVVQSSSSTKDVVQSSSSTKDVVQSSSSTKDATIVAENVVQNVAFDPDFPLDPSLTDLSISSRTLNEVSAFGSPSEVSTFGFPLPPIAVQPPLPSFSDTPPGLSSSTSLPDASTWRSAPRSNNATTSFRTACEGCRQRKGKCSGERPVCQPCVKRGKECVYLRQAPYMSMPETRQRTTQRERVGLEAEMESSPSSSRRPQETGRDPDILFRNHHEPQQTIAAASHSVQAAGVIAEGPEHPSSTSSSSLPNPPAILGDKRKDDVEHYRRPLKSRALERQQSRSPSNLDFSYGHTNEARRPDQGQIPSRQRIESFAARRTDRPPSMSSVTATTPNYPNSVQNRTTAVLPSNDQLLDSLPMATRLHDVLHSEAPIPAMSRLQPAGSRSMRTRIPSGVLPLESEASTLVSHFLDHTNTSLPILSKTRLWLQVEALYTNVHDVLKQEDVCLVFLVFACSASTIRGSCAEAIHLKERAPSFWAEASKHLAACTAVDSVLRIEIMLLHLQYVMYNPAAGVVWDLAGATMRTVIDSGFHHETSSTGKRDDTDAQIDYQVDRQRRLFWSIYCIDRNLATALGRPPGIPDNWISAELPSVLEDEYIEGRGRDGQPSVLSPSKLATRHHIRIRRLQSEVHNRLYSAAVPVEPPPQTWFDSVQSRLDQWREDWPAPTSFVSEEWLNLNYHMTVTLLLRPTAAHPNPDRSQTQTALNSSSQVMRFYKDMFRKGRINYNWVAMYQLFINGVTYLNGLWQAHRNGWSIVPTLVDALLDIQGCSSIIEALAVITPGSSGIRNAFERVSEGVIRHLSQYSRLAGLSRQVSPSGSQNRPPNGTTTVYSQPPQSSLDDYTQTTVEQLEPHNVPFAQVPQYPSGFPDILDNEIALDESLVFGEHPFDDLLFRPLGDYTGDQWDEAVNSVLDQMASQ